MIVLGGAGGLDAARRLDAPVLVVGGPDAPLLGRRVVLQLESLAVRRRLVVVQVLVRRRIHACTGRRSTLQTVYWILAASKGWIKQTYRKIMHTQNTQNHITGNDLVQIDQMRNYNFWAPDKHSLRALVHL